MDSVNDFSVILILPAAFALDLLIGDPPSPLHPVRLIGRLISAIEKFLWKLNLKKIGGGFLLLCTSIIIPVTVYILFRMAALRLLPAFRYAIDIIVLYSCIALRDMRDHILPIVKNLKNEKLESARAELSKIVGRDTAILDKHGIARATVETVSESFVDGFLAPIFWFSVVAILSHSAFLAVTAALIYRVTNTLDSMVGHHTPEYEYFGKPSAILDDALNFIPARTSIVFLTISSALLNLNTKEGIKIFMRDRLKHQSPNSAHAESFAAGALGLRLGGPTVYDGETISKPFIGDGIAEAEVNHIIKAIRLSFYAGATAIVTAELFIAFSLLISKVIKIS